LAAYVYEGMFILDSNRYGKDPNGVAGKIDALVESLEGTIRVSRLWAEQRLAYPINGQRRGTYWLVYFELDTAKMDELNYHCNINDDLLRFMFIKLDPRLADTLVAHAEGHGMDDSDDDESDDSSDDSSNEESADTDAEKEETVEAGEQSS